MDVDECKTNIDECKTNDDNAGNAFKWGYRNYCFTSYSFPNSPTIDVKDVKYYIYQLEKCPTTGNMHFQGYIELTKVMRFTALKKIFNDNTLHIEPRKGTQQ